MAREIELECPSGFKARMRSIKGKDIEAMADRRKSASGETISKLMDDCTIEILERSIYSGLKDFSWADALVGDRTYATIALRGATVGDEYDFKLRCQDQACGEMIYWKLNLKDLVKKPLSEQSRALFLDGNAFKTKIDDKLVVFKLNIGRDLMKLQKLMQQIEMESRRNGGKSERKKSLLGLGSRIVAVEGIDDHLEWLEELDLGQIRELVGAMDAADCGVDTAIEIVCKSCDLTQEVELPLDSTFFGKPL